MVKVLLFPCAFIQHWFPKPPQLITETTMMELLSNCPGSYGAGRLLLLTQLAAPTAAAPRPVLNLEVRCWVPCVYWQVNHSTFMMSPIFHKSCWSLFTMVFLWGSNIAGSSNDLMLWCPCLYILSVRHKIWVKKVHQAVARVSRRWRQVPG